jgi:hypothetical protein
MKRVAKAMKRVAKPTKRGVASRETWCRGLMRDAGPMITRSG